MNCKRLLCMLLALVTVLGCFVFAPPAAEAAEENGTFPYRSLEELKKKYPHGKYWNHYVNDESESTQTLWQNSDERFAESVTDHPCEYHVNLNPDPSTGEYGYNGYIGGYSCNVFDWGTQCAGFVFRIAYEVYGLRVSDWELGTRETIKPGDVIHYISADVHKDLGHWVFVTAIEGSVVTLAEGNVGGNCMIWWDRTLDLDTVNIKEVYSAPIPLSDGKITPKLQCWITASSNGPKVNYINTNDSSVLLHYELIDQTSSVPLLVDYDVDMEITITGPNGKLSEEYYHFPDEHTSYREPDAILFRPDGPGVYTYTVTCSGGYTGSVTGTFTVTDQPQVTRVWGANRYETSLKTAEMQRFEQERNEFPTVILTNGANFADALSGSYLASMLGAPVLLCHPTNKQTNQKIKDYIRQNLRKSGTVYILGGTSAVPAYMEEGLGEEVKVIRLAGNTRYDTNLAILNELDISPYILVCTGTDFADSLSASAVGKPILLVNGKSSKLTDSQKAFLASMSNLSFCIIGGENAVSKGIEKALAEYGTVTRLAGSTRYETSAMVAEKFFSEPESAVLAYGLNYPDGLCAGPMAYLKEAPMLLVAPGKEAYAKAYLSKHKLVEGYVLGGTGLIPNKTVKSTFGITLDELLIEG